ncbi:MAG: MvaI/BcnI family restriction endonuclease, partial [Enterovibrio sp.]
MQNKIPTKEKIRKEAAKLMGCLKISENEALDQVSAKWGYEDWFKFQAIINDNKMAPQIVSDISRTCYRYNKAFSDKKSSLDWEYKNDIHLLVERNKKTLVGLGLEFSLFEPTITGLKKSILDATQPVRTHFELVSFHDYSNQQQGPENKVIKTAYLLSAGGFVESKVSLYRPITKAGDPRMWFSNLGKIANSGDQVAIIINNDSAYLVNISVEPLDELLNIPEHPFTALIGEFKKLSVSVADELLQKLSVLAQAPFRAERSGSTGIGYTLEKLLGITANSSKLPDYKGIELKSGRSDTNRTTLFAQVANWDISPYKSSAHILDDFGYQREEDFKLYCTVSSVKPNSQGLHFKYDPKSDQLQEWYYDERVVAIWQGSVLRSRLKEKHEETF